MYVQRERELDEGGRPNESERRPLRRTNRPQMTRAQAGGHVDTIASQQRTNKQVLYHRVPPEKSENHMQHMYMHLSMQETTGNDEIVRRSKDTKGELEAGQDLPRGGIKNLPRGELELDGEEKTDRRKPARL